MKRRLPPMTALETLSQVARVSKHQPVRVLTGHQGSVLCVVMTQSVGQDLVASGGCDRTMRVWDASSGRCLRILRGHTGAVTSIRLSGNGTHLLSGSADGTMGWWNLSTGQAERFFGPLRDGPVTAVGLGPGERTVLARGLDARLHRWDLSTGKCLSALPRSWPWHSVFRRRPHPSGAVQSGFRWPFDARRELVLLGNHDSGLEIWDLTARKRLKRLQVKEERIHAVALSEDGRWALAGGASSILRVWDVVTGECIRELHGHTDEISGVCLSADGKFALSGSWDGTLRLWELRTGRSLRVLTGHADWIYSVAWSADKRLAASASADGTVRCWHLDE